MAGDTLTFDPAGLAADRTALSLHELGLEVREDGADWGESQVDTELVRQRFDSTVSDRHLPPVEATIPLRVAPEGEVTLAEAAQRLQQKIGLYQREGEGWVERAFEEGGGFAGAVAYRVHTASLSGLQGWLMAHRQTAPDVVLRVLRSPLAYATVEAESETFSETEERELIFSLAEVLGTAPGLIRVRITNDNVEGAWRGLILAGESRDHPQDATKDTTAKLAYGATELTLKGGSKSEGGVVKNTELTAGWLSILNSEISEGEAGHMTHKGVRRLWVRAEDKGEEAGDVELRLRYRLLGSVRWSENDIVESPLVDSMQWLDMGECRLEEAVVGSDRWECELQARAPGGSGEVWVDRIVPAPTELYSVLSTPETSQGADEQEGPNSPGKVESVEVSGQPNEEVWSLPENAKASDDSRATVVPHESTESSQYLKATKFAFAIPEAATVVGIVVEVERSEGEKEEGQSIIDQAARIVKGGSISLLENKASSEAWPEEDAYKTYGASDDLWGEEWTFSDINAEGFGFALRAQQAGGDGAEEARIDHIRITVYYTEAVNENRVCFAERSVELRHDGVVRQQPEDDVWGKVVPEGFLPYAPPSGLEERETRFVAIPSQGDLGEVADEGTNKLSAKVFTQAGYNFSREAS